MDPEPWPEARGLIAPPSPGVEDTMEITSHAVLEDVLYNVLHDILIQVHREEKIARGNTAAILIEQSVSQSSFSTSASTTSTSISSPTSNTQPTTPSRSQTPHRLTTVAAKYDSGEVYLRGNPLQVINEIRCPKCNLPKLLYPITGVGAREVQPGVVFCKRVPYVTKSGYDIYGLPFPVEEAKAPRKNAKIKTGGVGSQNSQSTTDGKDIGDVDGTSTGLSENGKAVFPTTKCARCGRYIPVRDFRKHLMGCMGISSRSSGRAAVLKKENSMISGVSQNGGIGTPPGSRRGTPNFGDIKQVKKPVIGSGSPMKRERQRDHSEDEDDDDEKDEDFKSESESPTKKKKLMKKVLVGGGGPLGGASIGKPRPRMEVLKKWKSGKVTLADGTKVIRKKDVRRDASESSETL